VGDLPPRLTGADPEGPAGAGEPPRPKRPSHLVPVALGILAGAAAIAVAVVLVTRGGDSSPATPAASSAADPVLRIIFPEGFTREQMAERIADVNGIARRERGVTTALSPEEYLFETKRSSLPKEFGADRRRSLEGFLFPATYDFTPKTTSAQLVDLQLDAFRDAWATVDLGYAKKRNLTPYDVLIIASMIQGEVRLPREQKLVAAVIYNRLRKDMPLGIDATLRYGLHIPPDESISQSDLESDNPYNTRRLKGLPPTPIDNPGLAAMEAAAHPANVDYLYYARKKDCKSHFFTADADAFFAFLDSGKSCPD
jgi:UPF0755 protein